MTFQGHIHSAQVRDRRWRCGRLRPGERLRAEDGFLLVEVLVAAIILVVGLLATFIALDVTVQTSFLTRAREGGVTLAREITDDARSIPFSQLSSATIVSSLQQMPGLADQGSGSTWQIIRRGVTYTVTVSESSTNDSKDGTGGLAVKQVTAVVQWTIGAQTRSVQEVATMSSAGQQLGLATSAIEMVSPSVSTQPTITSTATTQLGFQVTAPAGTTAIVWTVDGVQQPWTSSASGTTWTSSMWTISGLSDGTYQVGAQGENSQGIIGPAVAMPVVLFRNVPSAPSVPNYGYNSELGGKASAAVVELDWQRNTERNVTGYRIYNPSGTLICTTAYASTYPAACSASVWCATATQCIDLSPPSPTASNLTYQIAATYFDNNGNVQQGQLTSITLIGTPITTFTLAPTTLNISSNCSGSPAYDLRTTYTLASDNTVTSGQPVFCSRSFNAGQMFESGGTANVYFANSSSSSACTVTGTLNVDGSSSGALTATATVPKSSATTKYTFNFSGGQLLTMNAGDRFNLSLNMPGSSCTSTVLHYGGTSYPSQFLTPATPLDAPAGPASLTVTPQSNGSAILTWPEPSTGGAVSFFRIYRDGQSYTNRYDIADTTDCSGGTCSYTDLSRSSSHPTTSRPWETRPRARTWPSRRRQDR